MTGGATGRTTATLCAIAMAAIGLLAPSALAAGHELNARDGASLSRANPSSAGYWTKARMRGAESLDSSLRQARARSHRTLRHELRPTPRSSAGSRFDSSRSIAPRPATMSPTARRGRIHAPKYYSGEVPTSYYGSFPVTTYGRLFFTFGKSNFACSGTSIRSDSRSVVLTAGHCVHDHKLGWAHHVVFVPVYRQGLAPYGVWKARYETAPRGWVRGHNYSSDFAAIKVARSAYGPLGAFVGEEGLAWGQPRRQVYQPVGYPANLGGGEVMWTCVSKSAGADPYSRGPGAADTGIGCNMSHGASGGGWTIRNRKGVPFVNSVTSYGYEKLPNLLFGSYFTRKVPKLVHHASKRG